MNSFFGFLILSFLVLVQTTLWPLNLAFAALVWYDLFVEKIIHWGWLLGVAIMLSLFGNLNVGVVIISLTFAFIVLEIVNKIIPSNRLTKALLLVISLPLAEICLLLFSRLV